MPKLKRYYPTDAVNPIIMKSVLERIRLYIYAVLYPHEVVPDIGTREDRFIPADVQSGETGVNRRAVGSFINSNIQQVFTAYNVDDDSRDIRTEVANITTMNGSFYDSKVNSKITTIPILGKVLMFSFFYNRYDYERAMSILFRQASMWRRLLVPININSIATNIPLDLKIDPKKGTYALEFEKHLTTNKVFDISHPFDIKFYDVYADTNITPVDDMEAFLGKTKADDSQVREESLASQPTPVITNVSPLDGSTNVPVNSDIIFTFNVPMKETETIQSISISPFEDLRFSWGIDSLNLTISPYDEWQATTAYTITIKTSATSIYNGTLENEYIYNFTTV